MKHLSTLRKINQTEISLVVASERVSAQTLFINLNEGLWDLNVRPEQLEEQSGKSGETG